MIFWVVRVKVIHGEYLMGHNLSQEGICEIPLMFPSIKEQKQRCYLLECIDNKIRLNTRINRTIESMAKQLYDYWFVQFDFPDENGKPYKSSGGKMVWNEKLKREIPEGWYFDKLSEIVDIKNGATPSTADEVNYGGNVVWITPKDLSDQNSKFTYYGQR